MFLRVKERNQKKEKKQTIIFEQRSNNVQADRVYVEVKNIKHDEHKVPLNPILLKSFVESERERERERER